MSTTSAELQLEKISRFIGGIMRGRDPDLADHLQRLDAKTAEFGRYIGLSETESSLLGIGGGIHDIGKLCINEQVLNKPSRLTSAEFFFIKQHPMAGYQLLAPLELDTRVTDCVLHHHENFDGSGYPHGLAGENIPLFARIVRIWDSYDAITMNRPYHKGRSSEEALAILEKDKALYDPALLDSFTSMMRLSPSI
ncbi:HD-GYP domain-containing protein [Herminiimonas glaciei]|uniref:HD-GYP domain-containing protein n=1 Tax=Herminiimonas glaciei TaxID=523788 RepID=A0ABW2ICW3_9BURK